MRNPEWESLSDLEFDAVLQESLPELPPPDVVESVTPWRRAMRQVLTGLALTSITLNFLNLNYLFPAIGMLLLLLGFRTLRRENGWFGCGWWIAVIRAVYYFPLLILNATVYQSAAYTLPVFTVLSYANLVLVFLQFFCLWNGLKLVKAKVGLPPKVGAAAALLVWYGVLLVLALVEYNGIFIALLMIVAYFCILRSLFKLSRELDEAGYAIAAAPVRIADWVLVAAIAGAVLVGMAYGYLFLNRYPMDWQPVETEVSAKASEIRSQLAELGFPEEILDDLLEEDILACEGAEFVEVQVAGHALSNDVTEVQIDGVVYRTPVEELEITGIAVKLPGEPEQWKLFHHFRWVIDPDFCGTEALQLWPAYRQGGGWNPDGAVSGRVLYTKNGQSYAAPYHRLGAETYEQNSFFFGTSMTTDIFASFSMPRGGTDHRGYVSYGITDPGEEWMMDSWINYVHQQRMLQYPAMTALDYCKVRSWGSNSVFRLLQDALQFWPGEVLPD